MPHLPGCCGPVVQHGLHMACSGGGPRHLCGRAFTHGVLGWSGGQQLSVAGSPAGLWCWLQQCTVICACWSMVLAVAAHRELRYRL